jgi:hypothetical protein
MMRIQKNSSTQRFAYFPTKMYSGKWIWWQHYIRATEGKEVPALPVAWQGEYRRFTESEWSLELLKL